jgi:hypothetical protein
MAPFKALPRGTAPNEPPKGGAKSDPVLGSLIALARALRENPWYFSIVLVVYLNGIEINLYLLNNRVTFLAIFDNLAVGCALLGLVATVLLVRTRDLFPFTPAEAQKILIACLVVSSGWLMTLLLLIGINKGVQGFADEFRNTYGYDLRLGLKALLGLLWLVGIVWFFRVATQGAHRAIASERGRHQ